MTSTGIIRETYTYLNDVNDPLPGQSVSGSSQTYPGQVGAVMTLNSSEALKLSHTSVGTLYGGKYQYVQFYLSQSGTTVKNGPVYWQSYDNFVVTADVPTNGMGFAGIALNVVSKGNYGWICVAGKCNAAFGTVTKGSPAIGDGVSTASIGTFNDVDSTQTDVIIARKVGVAVTAPASDLTSLIYFEALPNAS